VKLTVASAFPAVAVTPVGAPGAGCASVNCEEKLRLERPVIGSLSPVVCPPGLNGACPSNRATTEPASEKDLPSGVVMMAS